MLENQPDYVIPASKAATREGQFSFQLKNKTIRVPLAQYLPVERALAASKFESGDFRPDDLRGIFAVLFGSDEVAGLLLQLDGEQLQGVMEAWRAKSEISVGESSPSDS